MVIHAYVCPLLTFPDIVMTPTKKGKTTHIRIEKKKKEEVDTTVAEHVGDGKNKGFVVNKKNEGIGGFKS